MASTEIEWCDKVWNPVRGCSRVSSGCDHCYAMGQAHRFSGPGKPYEGLTTIRRGKVDWAGVARLVPEQLDAPLGWKKPQRIFVNSMSDLFHESLSNEEIAAVFGVMAACPQHTFQVLTKRPKRMSEWFEWIRHAYGEARYFPAEGCRSEAIDRTPNNNTEDGAWAKTVKPLLGCDRRWPLPNVWLGVSVEDQRTADERIPLLLETPAAVRFVSAEPLLGLVNLEPALFVPTRCNACGSTTSHYDTNPDNLPVIHACLMGVGLTGEPGSVRCSNCGSLDVAEPRPLDWVIIGGESGHGARECEVSWIRRIVSDCQRAGTPVFVKQLGAHARDQDHFSAATENLRHKKGADMSEWPEDLRVRQMPGGWS